MLTEVIYFTTHAIVMVFLTCEHAQRFTNAFSGIDDVFDQLDWYLLPIEIKRILPTVILYVQQPVKVVFFGSFSCDRELSNRVSIIIYEALHFYLVLVN